MLLARLLKDRKGGVAPLLAVTAIPLIGAVGAAADYSRVNSTRTAMQAALDATALMLSRDALTLSSGQLNSKATAYFNALFHRPEASNVQVTSQLASPQQGSFVLTLASNATIQTVFWRLIGQQIQSCASKPDMSFNVQQASQLDGVLSSIAQNLANLRIVK